MEKANNIGRVSYFFSNDLTLAKQTLPLRFITDITNTITYHKKPNFTHINTKNT